MKSDFMVKTAKIIAEVRTRTCIDRIDVEVLEDILKDELREYYDELHDCYDAGYDDGYDEGYALGYDEGHSGVKTLIKMR